MEQLPDLVAAVAQGREGAPAQPAQADQRCGTAPVVLRTRAGQRGGKREGRAAGGRRRTTLWATCHEYAICERLLGLVPSALGLRRTESVNVSRVKAAAATGAERARTGPRPSLARRTGRCEGTRGRGTAATATGGRPASSRATRRRRTRRCSTWRRTLRGEATWSGQAGRVQASRGKAEEGRLTQDEGEAAERKQARPHRERR